MSMADGPPDRITDSSVSRRGFLKAAGVSPLLASAASAAVAFQESTAIRTAVRDEWHATRQRLQH